MWLLDANMDVHLVSVLADFGVVAEGASRRGWQALTNGDLVDIAVREGFTCVLTQDRLFGQSALGSLEEFPSFAVVIVMLAQRPWHQYSQDFRDAWAKSPVTPQPGKVVRWPPAID